MKKLCAAICMMASVGHAVSTDITHDELLNSDRLNIVSAETVQNANAVQTERLKQQLLNVKDNQTITIAPGKYANLGEITIAANNVTIKAETAGTAWLTGLVQLRVTGDNVMLDGLVFTEGGPAERFGGVRLMGDHNTLQNSTFHYFNHNRVYDEDHVIRNNYIANARGREGAIEGNADLRGAVVLNTGIIDVANDEVLSQETKGKELNKQWTPKNITVANNTIVDAQWGMVHGNQTHRVSLFDNSVVDNTFTGTNIQFRNNLVKNLNGTQSCHAGTRQSQRYSATKL